MFDIRIVNLDAGSYLHMMLKKSLYKDREGQEGQVGSCIKVDNSNVKHHSGPPLPEVMGAYGSP